MSSTLLPIELQAHSKKYYKLYKEEKQAYFKLSISTSLDKISSCTIYEALSILPRLARIIDKVIPKSSSTELTLDFIIFSHSKKYYKLYKEEKQANFTWLAFILGILKISIITWYIIVPRILFLT